MPTYIIKPAPDADTIEWAAEMLGCKEAMHRGQALGWCAIHKSPLGSPYPPCPVAVDLAAKIAARDARRDAQTRADECDQIAHLMSAGDGAFDRYLAERLNEPGVMRGFLLGRAVEHRERVQG